MKMKKSFMLAGAAAFALASSAMAAVEIGYTHYTGADDAWLAANNLQSAVFWVSGIPAGHPTLGILGHGVNPWEVATGDGSAFHNYAQNPFHGPNDYLAFAEGFIDFATDPDAAKWDSGFIGLEGWGLYAGDIGLAAFSVNGGGASEHGGIGALIHGTPNGWPAPGGVFELFRITWSADTNAYGAFNLALVEGVDGGTNDIMYNYNIGGPVPAPGALALLGVAGLVGTRRRRA